METAVKVRSISVSLSRSSLIARRL